jgi:hypothetical protein
MAKAVTGEPKAKAKIKPKPKLSNKERHKRFVEMAHKVEADESPDSFDRAFDSVIHKDAPIKSP